MSLPTCELAESVALPVTLVPSKRRAPRCLLDSAESQALLARHNIRLSAEQIATFRNIENHWEVDVFNPDTAGCLVNGRFDQTSANGYFIVIAAVEQLGRTASVERIVQAMATFFPEGVAYVLFSAAKCMLYSDAIAHEAYRQLMRSKIDKRRSLPRAAIREYRDRVALAEDMIKRAGLRSRGRPS